MDIDFKCYKIDTNSYIKPETQNSQIEIQNVNDFPKRRYQIIESRQENGRLFFLIKNLETGNTKEFNYADIKLYFYIEYLEYMKLKSKDKKQDA